MNRKQLQEAIKAAKTAARNANDAHKIALKALRAAKNALVAFDNGGTPAAK